MIAAAAKTVTQLRRALEAGRKRGGKGRKNSNINNGVKETGGRKQKLLITNEKTDKASHCSSANDNQLAIACDLGHVGV